MKAQIKVRAYSTTFLMDYPSSSEISIERAIEHVKKKVTYSAQVISVIYKDTVINNKNFKDPEKFEILNFDMSKYKKQLNK
jgi:hypothetical protein